MPTDEDFSAELERWLRSPGEKTLGDLADFFEERSFALALLVLMFPSALPLPTGGVTNLLELVAMLFAVQMMIGRRTVWLPRRLCARKLGGVTEEKAIPFIVRRVRWLEQYSRPRLTGLLDRRFSMSVLGFVVLVFTLGAFVSPPFSGLDTLPSLGVVLIALSLLLHDALVTVIGLVIGAVGIGLLFALGSVVLDFFF